MTLAVGRRFGMRNIVVFDTMISDSNAQRHDAIPGWLKCIVLSRDLSVTYAGDAEWALKHLRSLPRPRSGHLDEGEVVAGLLSSTNDGRVEYLLSSHQGGPHFRRVWSGRVSGPLEQAYIGSQNAYNRFRDVVLPPTKVSGLTPEELVESQFLRSWRDLYVDEGITMAAGVGGLPLDHLGSPYGYCYGNWSMSFGWDRIQIPESPEQHGARMQREASGESVFKCLSYGSNYRGVAVVGTYFEQVRLGYIYQPLCEVPVVRLTDVDQAVFAAEVDAVGKASGGFLVDP